MFLSVPWTIGRTQQTKASILKFKRVRKGIFSVVITFFYFFKNILYKNIEDEICQE